MDLKRKLKAALANFLVADNDVRSAKSEASRRFAEHAREVANAKFQKAQKRSKRARRQRQLRELGLGD